MCCEVYKNPKYLPCHHFFCEECLENKQKQSSCEQQAVIPLGGIKELDKAFFVNHLVNQFIAEHKEKGYIEEKCNGCSKGGPVEAFCPCSMLNMCSACTKNHKSDPKTTGYGIVPLKHTTIKPKPDGL